MKVAQIYLYPIKSLRGISIPAATICADGIQYDRRYILLKPREDGTYSFRFVGEQPEMALFHCALSSPTSFVVSYRTPSEPVIPPNPIQQTTIEIPFEPAAITDLEEIRIRMHKNPDFPARVMPDEYNKWFSGCFGYNVVLVYLGDGVGAPSQDEKAQYWRSEMTKIIPTAVESVAVSDGGALLVTSEASLDDLHPRLAGDEKVIHEKFRPNIIIEGAPGPWDEDFWGELQLPRSGVKVVLTSNCARCISVNVDLEKGKMGDGDSGKLLKKMMRDRRVDSGKKWEPIFGRYGFPASTGEIKVGDEVVVSRRNSERTIWNGYVPRLAKIGNVAA